MSENSLPILPNINSTPQCQFFVVRKKRLCRMTVRPGRQYCGEHEPEPRTEEGKDDTRIPCPYDPKHTCYASKLEKHLSICNARETELPPYIVPNINAPAPVEVCERLPLSATPREVLLQVIEKVNLLYEEYISGKITTAPQLPIHAAVQQEFDEGDRGERSRRHMRQASSLLHMAEGARLVEDRTCYVELGAGKGQLSFYIGNAWCGPNTHSNVVLIDRAALRHKRDNKLRECVTRIRADLKDLALGTVGEVGGKSHVVGFAKHLCGVATDYALRCMVSESVIQKTRGIVLATCCHHRCDQAAYVGGAHLQELGISGEELNVMLGIVSWATCGDGLSRERRKLIENRNTQLNHDGNPKDEENIQLQKDKKYTNIDNLEAGEHLELQKGGFDENVDGKTDKEKSVLEHSIETSREFEKQNYEIEEKDTVLIRKNQDYNDNTSNGVTSKENTITNNSTLNNKEFKIHNESEISKLYDEHHNGDITRNKKEDSNEGDLIKNCKELRENKNFLDNKQYRAEVGRRAKALLDWGRVLYLRERGFDARLCYYVPDSVSLENVCLVATKLV